MPSLSFLTKVMRSFNYQRMFKTIDMIHERSGKNKAALFCDMVWCGLRYGAGYYDYRLCEFYKINSAQRKTYFTRGTNNKLVKLLNNPAYDHCFENKNEFNEIFAPYVKRGWFDMQQGDRQSFAEFMKTREDIIAKPVDGTCGKGVEKLSKKDFETTDAMYDHIASQGNYILEDYVIQHPAISAIYPYSVNTQRIVTVLTEGVPHIVYSYIRIGNGGAVVDNINSGGMCAPIDIDTGVIQYPAYDKDEITYDVHPMTGKKITGFQIPFWKEAVDMCLEAATKVPQIGYIGWDICITPDGPLMIEGNNYPGHDFLQLPPHVPNREGMLPRFRMFVKGL